MLGAPAAAGRLFVAAGDSPGVPQTVVLSYGTWTRRHRDDRRVRGTAINCLPVDTMPQRAAESLARRRFLMWMSALFVARHWRLP
jgi:hypothetical protein